ncbi:hypothetical protein ACHQM5_014239 [Ranunculus cassubicifolius]
MKQSRLSMEVFILILVTFVHLSSFIAASDYTSLVYKGCGQQTYMDSSNAYTQTLSSLFDSLISQSSNTKFFQTTDQQTSFSALYQCRGDLNNGDCHNCVSKLPQTLNNLCGKTTSGRLQLLGCYILFEPFNSPEVPGSEMVYKTCSPMQAVENGFEERRDTAFAALERGIVSGYGFYTASYQSVYVLGQCEGDLGIVDCGECMKIAVQKAQVECGKEIQSLVRFIYTSVLSVLITLRAGFFEGLLQY